MTDPFTDISVICNIDRSFAFGFLETNSQYSVHFFHDMEQAINNKNFFLSQIVIVDQNIQPEYSFALCDMIEAFAPQAFVVQMWDFQQRYIPEVFTHFSYVIKKPFTREALLRVLSHIQSRDILHNHRRTQRVSVNLPVHIHIDDVFQETRAVNLSLQGMQAIWDYPVSKSFMYNYGHCHLFINDNDFSIPVQLRYIQPSSSEFSYEAVAGFEFGELDVSLRKQIYYLIAG